MSGRRQRGGIGARGAPLGKRARVQSSDHLQEVADAHMPDAQWAQCGGCSDSENEEEEELEDEGEEHYESAQDP